MQLLQDAWRMRCLGLTNSSLLPNNSNAESQSTSPNPKHPSPPLSPPQQSGLPNGPPMPDNHNQSGFILMHPAFQHSQKMLNASFGPAKEKETFPNASHLSHFNCSDFASRALQIKADKMSLSNGNRIANNATTDDEHSSSSEEIDLTSNVCVDFSNSNKSKCK